MICKLEMKRKVAKIRNERWIHNENQWKDKIQLLKVKEKRQRKDRWIKTYKLEDEIEKPLL